jgi:hypothetical protein
MLVVLTQVTVVELTQVVHYLELVKLVVLE